MATHINNNPGSTREVREVHHEHGESGGGGMGFLLGVIVLVVFAALFLVYGLPYIQNSMRGGGTNINIPDKINIDVNRGGQ
jgi:hypothetical protein